MASANTLPSRSQCAMCKSKEHLSRCAGCQAIAYCNREHQAAHWSQHKIECTPVKKARTKMDKEERKLREMPGDMLFQANPFENSIGHFWGIMETRDYMRARYGVLEALLKIHTREAVQASLDHTLDMLRLCRSDNMGVRSLVPALYLRLGRDQEAYDAIKWWCQAHADSHYDWGDTELPYLNLRNENVFEPLENCMQEYQELSHRVAVALIKVRLLVDLRTLQNATAVGEKVPPELLDNIREQLVSPVIAGNVAIMRDITTGKSMAPHIANIESQLGTIFKTIQQENKHFWPALQSPGAHLTARPPYTSAGTVEEMQLALQQNYDSWIETPGAIEVVSEQVAKLRSRTA